MIGDEGGTRGRSETVRDRRIRGCVKRERISGGVDIMDELEEASSRPNGIGLASSSGVLGVWNRLT